MDEEHDTVQEKRNACRALVGKPRSKINLANLGVDGMILLKWNLNKMGEGGLESCKFGNFGKLPSTISVQYDIYDMIFINCNWVCTQWQWLVQLYTNRK